MATLLSAAKDLTGVKASIPTLIPKEFKTKINALAGAPDGLKGTSKMVIKAGLKSYKKKTPVRFFRISNKAWGVIVGDF